MAATDTDAPAAAPPTRQRRTLAALDALVVMAVVVLVVFPVVAWLAARAQPVAPGPAIRLAALPTGGAGERLTPLPAGLSPGGSLPTSPREPLGGRITERRLERVSEQTPWWEAGNVEQWRRVYRDAGLERLLPARPAADLGARLLLLAAGRESKGAAAAAYEVLDHARRRGGCASQLDLLVLVAAGVSDGPADVQREAARARAACPRDPTPLWLVGQYQSQQGEVASALATFRALQRAFPRSAVGWSGEADAYLRVALGQPATARFTARLSYAEALARYRRAARLNPNPEVQLGIARALDGLGRPREAARVQAAALGKLPATAASLGALVHYLEDAHRHADAAKAAARLERFVPGPARGVVPGDGALSLGATLAPLEISIRRQPSPTGTDPGGVTVSDTSYLPPYRESAALEGEPALEEVDGLVDRSCVEFVRRRNLIAAGEARAALEGIPRSREALSAGCVPEGWTRAMLAGIAWLEIGDRRAARNVGARMAAPEDYGPSGIELARIDDARQNLWRWAGNLPRAERAAREWDRASRGDPAALLRVAEIEYLRGRHDAAARDFGVAARRARTAAGTWGLTEAAATLERAGALLASGRRDEALREFTAADDIASRAMPAARRAEQLAENTGAIRAEPAALASVALVYGTVSGAGSAQLALEFVSYHARAQLADAAREDGNLELAAERYRAARELEPSVEVDVARVANNGAIVSTALGRGRSANAMVARALSTDPRSPVFLATAAAVAARSGRPDDAIRRSRAALAADPTMFPAANDLGVLLARQGRERAAVAALRRAVGANERYALGWFNLGVVLSRMGPLHLPAAQGALGRAFTLAPALRDRERRPTLDGRTYRSGLDLARPLPPKWNFAESQRRAPAQTAGLAAILLVALALGRSLANAKSGREAAETWLAPFLRAITHIRIPEILRRPAVALAATLAVLLYPLARDPGGGLTAAIAGAAALGLLVLVVVRARAATARRHGDSATQESWPPGLAFGAGTAIAGLTWAPLPVLSEGAAARTHWAGPLALAAIAIPLVLFTAWLGVPLARAVATAALIMAASLLTPIKPVDGGAIAAAGGTAAGLTGLGLAALLALGLV